MESVDALVTQTQALLASGRRDDEEHLLGLLQQKGADLLAGCSSAELERLMGALDPQAHALSWLFVLDAFCTSLWRSGTLPAYSQQRPPALSGPATAAAQRVVSLCSTFIAACSAAQIRLDPARFASVCRRFKDALLLLSAGAGTGPLSAQIALQGVLPLTQAVQKAQVSHEHLTPVHADCLQLCLLAHAHDAGHRLLQREGGGGEQLLCEVDPAVTGLTQTDFLLFCYYGGMVCIGVKNLDQAMRLFLLAITAPAIALSAITVAAYKKHVLLSLILSGKVGQLPRFAPSVVQRQIKMHVQEYTELADAYVRRDPQELQGLLTKYKDVYAQDGNLGLAKQVLASVFKRSIQRLTQTYLTLSLQDIATTVKLPSARDAERHIRRMIQGGEIHASISQKEGMVSFLEDPEKYNTHRMARKLNTHISRAIELGRKLEDMDSALACDRHYLQRVHTREKTGRFVDPEDVEFGGPSRMFDTM